ncbi:hypothetical protein F2P81_021501 [Scophthalmus maximus]|uniref:Uncharacterized protein n=1 Tax=Scophthalmus maximus TaxID=52904 RepID=A0A6A4S819_SCOMX|nr:hypothetical protein F2P81_021501 [Scophthalmus maximus]
MLCQSAFPLWKHNSGEVVIVGASPNGFERSIVSTDARHTARLTVPPENYFSWTSQTRRQTFTREDHQQAERKLVTSLTLSLIHPLLFSFSFVVVVSALSL